MGLALFVFGNSHVWTLLGWDRFAPRDSVRLEASFGDLRLVGMAVTAASAHNLSRRPETVIGFLDGDPDPDKSVLFVFGDMDVRRTVARHPDSVRSKLEERMSAYETLLSELSLRSDIGHLLVGSVTGYHGLLPMDAVAIWNDMLADVCHRRRWTYVDLTTPGIGVPSLKPKVTDENHLDPSVRDSLLAAIIKLI